MLYRMRYNNVEVFMQDNQRQAKLIAYAYIAGIIDGEGAMMITKSPAAPHRGRKSPSYTPRIKVSMTDEESVKYILKNTNIGKVSYEPTRRSRPRRKGLWIWQVYSRESVMNFLHLIEPYLVLKIPHAKCLREFCDNFDEQIKCMDGVKQRALLFREKMQKRMKSLNICSRKSVCAATETEPQSTVKGETTVRTNGKPLERRPKRHLRRLDNGQ